MSEAESFVEKFLAEAAEIVARLDRASLEKAAKMIGELRSTGGRLFILGVGGSAANASHAVNDFRKIAGIEAYAPTDNVSELTARTNDEGWATVFEGWLKTSKLQARDAVLVFSVGGGDLERNVSPNLVAALKLAKAVGAKIIGVVGRDGGYTAKVADVCVLIPVVNPVHVPPHSEAFQAVVWHLLVSHPAVRWSRRSGSPRRGRGEEQGCISGSRRRAEPGGGAEWTAVPAGERGGARLGAGCKLGAAGIEGAGIFAAGGNESAGRGEGNYDTCGGGGD